MSIFLKAALEYEAMGFSVIPLIEGDKKAKVEWKEFQTRRSTPVEIVEWWKWWPNANIGIVTGSISGICVVDLDRYKENFNPENELLYFPDTLITPSVSTPRGGCHLWFRSPPEQIAGRADIMPGIDLRCEGNYIVAPPSLNGSGNPYTWIVPNDGQFAIAPALFIEQCIKRIDTNILYTHGVDKTAENPNPQESSMSTNVVNVYKSGHRDEDLFHLAHTLVKGKCKTEFIYKTLDIIAKNCDPPFPSEEAIIKIQSAMERANRKDRNLMAEVREYVLSSTGIILSTDVSRTLHLSTREELKNLSICLSRLSKDEGLLVRHGNKNGMWRCVDQSEEIIDYLNVDTTPFDIKFPLGIHQQVKIHKGNVVVVAGESNAGKTALLLNIAYTNRNEHNVNYLTSEMKDGTELRVRIDKFNHPLESWEPIKFQFRTDGFPDKIDPDGLNIIDYLDEGSDAEAYKMPHRLREIADCLKQGIAIVAIQKSPNKDYGFGGAGTMNRSRLYLTITKQNILTIVKGKIWANEMVNPNGLFCKFSLVAGCKFTMDGAWKR